MGAGFHLRKGSKYDILPPTRTSGCIEWPHKFGIQQSIEFVPDCTCKTTSDAMSGFSEMNLWFLPSSPVHRNVGRHHVYPACCSQCASGVCGDHSRPSLEAGERQGNRADFRRPGPPPIPERSSKIRVSWRRPEGPYPGRGIPISSGSCKMPESR